ARSCHPNVRYLWITGCKSRPDGVPGSVRGWLVAVGIHRVVLSHSRKMSYEHVLEPRPRSVPGQFTCHGCLSFVVNALYGECCVGIASTSQRPLSTNGRGQAPKNAEFILDKDLS